MKGKFREFGMTKDAAAVIERQFEELGVSQWDFVRKKKHCQIYFTTPDGHKAIVTVAGSPSCARALGNLRGDIRRACRLAGSRPPR